MTRFSVFPRPPPNPVAKRSNPYVPTNMPALADLFDNFDFASAPDNQPYLQ
jgi:phospholipase C